MMNSKIFFSVFVLLVGLATFTHAQGRGGYNRHHGAGRYHNKNGYYNNAGNCNHNNAYYPNGSHCNHNNDAYYNDTYGRNSGAYRIRRVYRRPVNYCQQVPVVVSPSPDYCPPPHIVLARPRVHINIGF